MKHDSTIQRVELRLHEWFFADASVAPLALVRIGLGLIAVLSTLQYLPHAEWMWGEDGFMAHAFKFYESHPLRYHTELILGAIILSSLCLTVGFQTRVTGLIAALMLAVLGSSGHSHTWGWSTVMPVLVGIVALSPAGQVASVDAWIARRRGVVLPAVAPRWSLRLLQLHVAVVYLSASWHRINDRGWLQGEMVYAAVANGMYTRFPYLDPQPLKPVFLVLTFATEWIELAAPIALWIRRVRIPMALGLMAVHLGLEVSAIVGWWQPMMLTLLWVFLPPGWSARVLAPVWRAEAEKAAVSDPPV